MILLDITPHIDATVSLWEFALVVVAGLWRLIVMHFEIKELKKCVEDLEAQKDVVNRVSAKVGENAVLIQTTLDFMRLAISELKTTVDNLRNERSSRSN